MLWDFGDGQSSRKAVVEHVYLIDGQYAVTLTVNLAGKEYRRTNRVSVSRPWDQVTSNKLDGLQRYAAIVAEYDFPALSDQAVETACRLFQETQRPAELVRAAETMLGRRTARGRALVSVLGMYTEVLSGQGQSGRAAQAMLQAAEKADRPDVRAGLLVGAGQLFLEASPDGDEALAAFEQAIASLDPSSAPAGPSQCADRRGGRLAGPRRRR